MSTTFIQLSKHQKKFFAHVEAKGRRMREHDKNFPSAAVKAAQARAREEELKALVAAQERDRVQEAQMAANAEEQRKANAQKWQEQHKGLKIRKLQAEVLNER